LPQRDDVRRHIRNEIGHAIQRPPGSRRRTDPQRIYIARRAARFRRLVDGDHLDELDAEHWISRWEREAEASGRARNNHYWSDAWDWIADNRLRP